MKYLTILVLIIALGLTLFGCIVDSPSGDDCNAGDQQCFWGTLQHCDNGSWIDWTNCATEGLQCVELEGEAQCIGGDTDTDTDTDSDTDTDTDSDTDADIQCDGTPKTCEGIGPDDDTQYYGCCDGEVVYWCEPGSDKLLYRDCSAYEKSCMYVEKWTSMYCG
jgi:hypothetical protein